MQPYRKLTIHRTGSGPGATAAQTEADLAATTASEAQVRRKGGGAGEAEFVVQTSACQC